MTAAVIYPFKKSELQRLVRSLRKAIILSYGGPLQEAEAREIIRQVESELNKCAGLPGGAAAEKKGRMKQWRRMFGVPYPELPE